MSKWLLFFALFSARFIGMTQSLFPVEGYVFDDNTVPQVRVYLPQDSLDLLLSPFFLESNHEYPATFVFIKNNQHDTLENVGLRLRGNTSRNAEKKSFKIAFNSFDKGQKYHGLEKMNLNGEHNDPTIIRSKLCWDLYREAGIPGSRSNHVAFYINDEFRGLYLHVEHIDEEFIKARFEQADGNLYKCLWPADLHYRGADPNLYKVAEPWGRQAYELKTNLKENNYSDLARFIDILNNYQGDDFICEVEEVFEVDRYLRAMAMDILTSNWDGAIFNKNNFYLYNNPCNGKFTYLPYDLDNTLGIDWFSIDWPTTAIYTWGQLSGQYRPIYQSILSIDQYRAKFSYYMNTFIGEFFNNDYLDPILNQSHDALLSFREDDTYAELDYAFTVEDFTNGFNQIDIDHVKYGLKDYISRRRISALNQLQISGEINPTLIDHQIEWKEDVIDFNFGFQDHGGDKPEIKIHYTINQGMEEIITLADTGGLNFPFTHPVGETGKLNYFITATLPSGLSRRFPYCDYYLQNLGYQSTPQLVINEFMASNQSGLQDESGAFTDWIEIYNAGPSSTPLWDLYLTDDPDEPNKWELPNTVLGADDYIVIFADNDEEQGSYHANFKLKKEGEFIGIFDNKDNNFKSLDSLTYGPQTTDISSARIPNGSGPFTTPMYITPGHNNEEVLDITQQEMSANISIYPNPTSNHIFIKGYEGPIIIQNVSGTIVLHEEIKHSIDLSLLPPGIYFTKVVIGKNWVSQKVVKI